MNNTIGQPCTCKAKAGICNATDCQQPWAVEYRKSIRPTLLERIVGILAVITHCF